MPVLEARSSSLKSERSDLLERLSALQARVSEHAASLGVPEDLRQSTSYLMGIGSDQTDQAELQRIAQVRRDVSAAKSQWDSIQQMLTGSAITEAERGSAQYSQALEAWRCEDGEQVTRTISRVKAFLSDVPDPATVGPASAVSYSTEFVRKELRRYSELLKRDADATSQIAMVDEQLQRAEARLKVLDEQIAGHLANADRLAQALTSLLPLVEGQECPVCGRDFGEEYLEHLQSHLSAKISNLVESAGRLQGFVRERSDALRIQTEGSRRREGLVSFQLESEERTRLSLLHVELGELERRRLSGTRGSGKQR